MKYYPQIFTNQEMAHLNRPPAGAIFVSYNPRIDEETESIVGEWYKPDPAIHYLQALLHPLASE